MKSIITPPILVTAVLFRPFFRDVVDAVSSWLSPWLLYDTSLAFLVVGPFFLPGAGSCVWSPGLDVDGSLGFLSKSPPSAGIVSWSLPKSTFVGVVAVGPVCALDVSADGCIARLTEIIGKSSLSSDSEPLFSNRRSVCFLCFSETIRFVARSLTSRGVGGGNTGCDVAFDFFDFGFVATPNFLSTTPLSNVNV